MLLTLKPGLFMRQYTNNLLFRVGVVMAGLLLIQGCSDEKPVKKEIAQDFALELFEGGRFQLGDHKGKPVLINFLASWCIPCREEIPALNQIYGVYKHQGVVFLAIAVDDTRENIKKFINKYGLELPAGIDTSGKIKDAFGLYGVPTTLFIDKQGFINYLHPGSVTESLLHHELDQLL